MAADQYYGARDPERLFQGRPATMTPWDSAGRRKDRQDFDPEVVNAAVREGKTEPVDPRQLHASQPMLTRAGVAHYMTSNEVYKDQHQAGNQRPVVYDRNGTRVILSGHHRAAAALLRGEQFHAVVAKGDWGPPR